MGEGEKEEFDPATEIELPSQLAIQKRVHSGIEEKFQIKNFSYKSLCSKVGVCLLAF